MILLHCIIGLQASRRIHALLPKNLEGSLSLQFNYAANFLEERLVELLCHTVLN